MRFGRFLNTGSYFSQDRGLVFFIIEKGGSGEEPFFFIPIVFVVQGFQLSNIVLDLYLSDNKC